MEALPKKDWTFRGGVSTSKSIKIATWKRSPQLDRKDKQRDAGITLAPRDCFSGTNLLPTTTISPTKSSGLAMQIISKKNSSPPSSNYIANSDSGDSIKMYRNKNIYGKNVDDSLSWGGIVIGRTEQSIWIVGLGIGLTLVLTKDLGFSP